MSELTPLQVLAAARDHLREFGWCQGWWLDVAQAEAGVPLSECRTCLRGAINVAAGGDPRMTPDAADVPLDLVEAHLFATVGASFAAQWNDEPGRTLAEVVALLDAVIERQRAVTPA